MQSFAFGFVGIFACMHVHEDYLTVEIMQCQAVEKRNSEKPNMKGTNETISIKPFLQDSWHSH